MMDRSPPFAQSAGCSWSLQKASQRLRLLEASAPRPCPRPRRLPGLLEFAAVRPSRELWLRPHRRDFRLPAGWRVTVAGRNVSTGLLTASGSGVQS